MKKYFIYARAQGADIISTSKSIQKQIKGLEQFARDNNIQVAGIFSEVGSAKSTDRKGFQEMTKRAGNGDVDGILCTDLDRLSRGFATSSLLCHLIEEHGIEILTPFAKYDASKEGLLLLTVHFASQYFKRRNS